MNLHPNLLLSAIYPHIPPIEIFYNNNRTFINQTLNASENWFVPAVLDSRALLFAQPLSHPRLEVPHRWGMSLRMLGPCPVLPYSVRPRSSRPSGDHPQSPLLKACSPRFCQECCSLQLESYRLWFQFFQPLQASEISWAWQLHRLKVERPTCRFYINAWFCGDLDVDPCASRQCRRRVDTSRVQEWFRRHCWDGTTWSQWSWYRSDDWQMFLAWRIQVIKS